MINSDSANFSIADALYNHEDVTADDFPIRLFEDNETFAAREGLHIVKANPNQGHDVWEKNQRNTMLRSVASIWATTHLTFQLLMPK